MSDSAYNGHSIPTLAVAEAQYGDQFYLKEKWLELSTPK